MSAPSATCCCWRKSRRTEHAWQHTSPGPAEQGLPGLQAPLQLAPPLGRQLGVRAVLFGTVPKRAQGRALNPKECHTLRLVLGDQLNPGHSWFRVRDPQVLYMVAELRQEATYARHHAQKVTAFFAAMQAFAAELRAQGHRVLYLDLDQTETYPDLNSLLAALLAATGARRFEYQRPDEYRLLAQLETFSNGLSIEHACCDSEHFLLPYEEIPSQFRSGRVQRMEAFYRRMRRRLNILVDPGGQPEGGRWNYDIDNRDKLSPDSVLPPRLSFANPVVEIIERIERHGIPVVGRHAEETLDWPIDRQQSLALLDHFVRHALPCFGRYQDALSASDWLLFHSRLSFSLNTKMLTPFEVVKAALGARDEAGHAFPLASVEGFIRQIIGWREFMRGIYWANMPAYARVNFFAHQRRLPRFYWDGDTRMACMAQAIGQSLQHAYAHHIQRLMVTGNFALLAGIDPDEVDAWYLGVYIDAVEWVEMPNTRGMSQYADGGLVASKPYVSSGNYIRKMGDHCTGCHYRVTAKTGPTSCPFNSLYWHFMVRNRDRLAANPRVSMAYRTWDRMGTRARTDILETAQAHLDNIDSL